VGGVEAESSTIGIVAQSRSLQADRRRRAGQSDFWERRANCFAAKRMLIKLHRAETFPMRYEELSAQQREQMDSQLPADIDLRVRVRRMPERFVR
jgi:hypothetical protein